MNPHEIQETIVNESPYADQATEDAAAERTGKIGWAILWLLGVPLPVLLVLYFLTGGGCNGG